MKITKSSGTYNIMLVIVICKKKMAKKIPLNNSAYIKTSVSFF